jgi:hypothetical protein
VNSELNQADLDEIAADPDADESDSSSKNSDIDRDVVAEENEDNFSKENESNGLVVRLDYFIFHFFCSKTVI